MGAVRASELSNISLGRKCLNSLEAILGLPEFQITAIAQAGQTVTVSVEYTGKVSCPKCGGSRLRKKDSYRRQVRHESLGSRWCVLDIELRETAGGSRRRTPGRATC